MWNRYMAMLRKGLLSKWSIIPAFLLLVITVMIMMLQLFQADGLQREPSIAEKLLVASPIIPLVWFVSLFIAACYRLFNKGFNKYDVLQIVVTLALLFSVSIFII